MIGGFTVVLCRCTSSFTSCPFASNFSGCFWLGYLSQCLTMSRHDALYASFLLLGILGTFKAYLTLADPGLFLSMFAIFPEVYPCVFASLLLFVLFLMFI